jgi:hypothetical protein
MWAKKLYSSPESKTPDALPSVDSMGFPVCGQGVENPAARSCLSLRLPLCLSVQVGDERVL